MLTLLLSLVLILALCLLLYAAVALIQNRKLFTTAPKDIQAAAGFNRKEQLTRIVLFPLAAAAMAGIACLIGGRF